MDHSHHCDVSHSRPFDARLQTGFHVQTTSHPLECKKRSRLTFRCLWKAWLGINVAWTDHSTRNGRVRMPRPWQFASIWYYQQNQNTSISDTRNGPPGRQASTSQPGSSQLSPRLVGPSPLPGQNSVLPVRRDQKLTVHVGSKR